MKIVIVGCGKIGTNLIASLSSEGHDVVAVDNDPEVVENITTTFDVMSVCGNGTDYGTLIEADVSNAELFIAATGSDEKNMLSCFIAGKMGASNTISRIRKPEYNESSLEFLKPHLGLSMAINPEYLAAQELFNILKLPTAVKIETFSRRSFEMVEFLLRENSPLVGVKLLDLRNKYAAKFLVCTVQRNNEIIIPDGNFVLNTGDRIGITATPSEIQKLVKSLGESQKKVKDVMILGGSRIAYYLAKMLLEAGTDVKIIEKEEARCTALCEILPGAVIIHGDGASQEILLEEGIRNMDAFVTLTGMDEENILLSFFASSQNVPKAIAKINRDELAVMAEKLGLDTRVSPKNIVSDVVVRYARAIENSLGTPVETLYKLMDGAAEAIEFVLKDNTEIQGVTGIKLKDLNTKKNVLIAGIIRENNPIIPTGEDMMLPGDRVIVISAGRRLYDLSEII